MSRRRKAEQRTIQPDPILGDVLVSKFINRLMMKGKKNTAEKIFYQSLEQASGKLNKQKLEVFHQILENIRPSLEVRSRRIGGATYQVPVEVRPVRQNSLAIRWLIFSARQRGEKSMTQKLYGEFLDAFNKTGKTIKKREEIHRMAESNKAFAHFRW